MKEKNRIRKESGKYKYAEESLCKTACCCLCNDKHSKIVLFLEQEMSRSELNQRLRDLLPNNMLQGKVICVDKLPLNSNGKIDRIKQRQEKEIRSYAV